MSDFDFKSLLGDVAPTIASAIVGGLTGGAGTAATLLANKAISKVLSFLGVEESNDRGDNLQAIAIAAKDPNLLLSIKKAEQDFQLEISRIHSDLAKAYIDAQIENANAVNTTMRVEAQSEHWLSWSWRPITGLATIFLIVADYFVLPLLKIAPPVIPTEIWLLLGGILGVQSFFRSKAQADPNLPTDMRG
jgi:hypothetical protein